MTVLAVIVACDTAPGQGWLKIYNLQECSASSLEAFINIFENDADKAKINFVRDSSQKIKSIQVKLTSTVDATLVSHILARFIACTGFGVKMLDELKV